MPDTKRVDELLALMGAAYRAAHPAPTPEQAEADLRDSRERLARGIAERLDVTNEVACHLCHATRPRRPEDEGHYYDCAECPNARKFWHFHRNFSHGVVRRRWQQRRRRCLAFWYRIRPTGCR